MVISSATNWLFENRALGQQGVGNPGLPDRNRQHQYKLAHLFAFPVSQWLFIFSNFISQPNFLGINRWAMGKACLLSTVWTGEADTHLPTTWSWKVLVYGSQLPWSHLARHCLVGSPRLTHSGKKRAYTVVEIWFPCSLIQPSFMMSTCCSEHLLRNSHGVMYWTGHDSCPQAPDRLAEEKNNRWGPCSL